MTMLIGLSVSISVIRAFHSGKTVAHIRKMHE